MRTSGRAVLLGFVIALAITLSAPIHAAGKGEPGPILMTRVELIDRQADLQQFAAMDLDVDGVFDGWARVYLTEAELSKLQRMGYAVSVLPPTVIPQPDMVRVPLGPREPGQRSIPAQYHTYATLKTELYAIAAANPDRVQLQVLGTTMPPNLRELIMLKISTNPDLEEDEPEVAYIAAMHGDEVVGKELCVEFIHYLLDNYGTDPRVTNLLDTTVIWIMPSMNPDGTELGQRYNTNDVDLNRDFPDWFQDPNNTPLGRQLETQAVMDWVARESINLSANFHGGALVANYPWDNNETGSSVYSPAPAPDHSAFHDISLTYAQNNAPMHSSPTFTDGVTNGAEWYAVTGGMQDWSYAWYGKWDVTLEVSDNKWPAASQLPTFWNDNRESMLSYIERAHDGQRGVVTDAALGVAVAAEIRLDTDPFAVYTDPDYGDYHRIVLPGSYTMDVSATGYYPQTVPITVAAGPAVRYDVALQPLPPDLQPLSFRLEDGGDQALDAGETANLAVTLKNLEFLASSVGGRLISTGYFANIPQADATYGDLANLAEVESAAPYYTVAADAQVPPGHKLGFAVEWSAAQGSGVSDAFFVSVGGTTCITYPAGDVPQAIVDFETLSSDIVIGAGAEIDEIRVLMDISHTFIGDLQVELTSPGATAVLLHDRSGSDSDDIVGTYGVDLVPDEPLSAFDNESSTGTWTLEVGDNAGGDAGNLNSWSLEICGRPAEAATPRLKFRDASIEPGGALFRWWPYPGMQSYKMYRSADPTSPAAFLDVSAEDGDTTDTSFLDVSGQPLSFFLVTGVGPQGEGPLGHFGQ